MYILDDNVLLKDVNEIFNYPGSEVVVCDTIFKHLDHLAAKNHQIRENLERFMNETEKTAKITLLEFPSDVYSDDYIIQYAEETQQQGLKKKVVIVTEDLILRMKDTIRQIEAWS